MHSCRGLLLLLPLLLQGLRPQQRLLQQRVLQQRLLQHSLVQRMLLGSSGGRVSRCSCRPMRPLRPFGSLLIQQVLWFRV